MTSLRDKGVQTPAASGRTGFMAHSSELAL
jgi:hypothetical protein